MDRIGPTAHPVHVLDPKQQAAAGGPCIEPRGEARLRDPKMNSPGWRGREPTDVAVGRGGFARLHLDSRRRVTQNSRTMKAGFATLWGAVLCTAACATSPTGRKQLILVPDQQMNAMGVQAFQELKQQETVSRDPAANTYVRCVSQAILDASRKELPGPWEIVVFDSSQVNAFALPGGKIGVYTGMVAFAANPGQLAAVVGHEVGHVIARHGAERMSQALAATGALSVFDMWKDGGDTKNLVVAALGLGFDLGIAKPHSRSQESESDSIGLQLMAKAGFDPQQAVELWRRMAQRGRGPPEFLSTHPAPANRAAALQKQQPKAQPLYAQARRAGRKPNCQKPNLKLPPPRG